MEKTIKRCQGQNEDEVCPFRINCLRFQQLKWDIVHQESHIPIEKFLWNKEECENKIEIKK